MLEWEKNIGNNSRDLGAAIKETNNGEFIAVGSSLPSGQFNVSIFDYLATKLSATGEVIWERRFEQSSTQFAADIIEHSSGGYLIAGHSRAFSTDGTEDAWIVRFTCDMDELPITVPDLNNTEIAITNKVAPTTSTDFKLYPNPSTGPIFY